MPAFSKHNHDGNYQRKEYDLHRQLCYVYFFLTLRPVLTTNTNINVDSIYAIMTFFIVQITPPVVFKYQSYR